MKREFETGIFIILCPVYRKHSDRGSSLLSVMQVCGFGGERGEAVLLCAASSGDVSTSALGLGPIRVSRYRVAFFSLLQWSVGSEYECTLGVECFISNQEPKHLTFLADWDYVCRWSSSKKVMAFALLLSLWVE